MEKSKKEHILETAIKLIAKYGFAATGVRKIANEAGVNVSMISYYFGSKDGMLKELISNFFVEFREKIKEYDLDNMKLRERFLIVARIMISSIRENEDKFKIVLYENLSEYPEINKYRVEKIRDLIKILYGDLVDRFFNNELGEIRLDIIAPLFPSMLYSHFFLKSTINEIIGIEYNDEFYEKYPEVIVNTFFDGSGLDKLEKK